MARRLWLVGVVLGLGACTCGDSGEKTPVEAMSSPGGQSSLTLEPVPQPPALDIAQDALPGGALTVVVARPQGEQRAEVRPTVTFSVPVKSLEMVESQRAADEKAPFARIEPALPGEWRWLGSASAEFVPSAPVPFSTDFTVTVLKGLKALDGTVLEDDYTFHFSTPTLELQEATPASGFNWVEPRQVITLLFNQAVDEAALVKALTLTTPAGTVPLRVTKSEPLRDSQQPERDWEGDSREGRATNHQVRYTLEPTVALPLDAAVSLRISDDLAAKEGPKRWASGTTLQWRTYGPMHVTGARFCDERQRCPWGPLFITTTNEIDLETLKKRLTVKPPVDLNWDEAYVWGPTSWRTTPTVSVPGAFKPGTTYSVDLAPGVEDIFKQSAAKGLSDSLSTDDRWPSLSLGGSLGLLEATGKAPRLPVDVANLEQLDVRMWKLSVPELVTALARPGSDDNDGLPRRPADFSELQQLTYPKNASRAHPLELRKALGASATTGVAMVSVDSPQLEYRRPNGQVELVQVTDLAAHIKVAPASSLVWVTRLSDGMPVADADVSVYDKTARQVWKGKTDADGFADVPGAVALGLPPARYSWEYPFALVVAQKDGDLTATANTWASGVEAYEFGLREGWEGATPASSGLLFSERGIYRPGDEVFLKGVVRYRVVGQLRAPAAGSTLTLRVSDSRGNEVHKEDVKVTKYGTFSSRLTIGREVPTGYCSVAATGHVTGGDVELSGGFRVEEYRAPQFRVDVDTPRPSMVAGAPLEATVSARYLFGGAMSDARVKWSSQRTSTIFAPASVPDFTFAQETWWWDDGDASESSSFFAAGEGTVDARGTLALQVGTPEAPGEKPWVYTVEAEVTDVNRQAVAGRTSVTVHPADYYVGLRSPTYFMAVGTEYGLETLTLDTSGKRAAGQPVEVVVTSRSWKSVKKKDASGGYATVSEAVEEDVKRCNLTSAEEVVKCPFKPEKGGFYIVRARVKDKQGRSHSSSLGLYATGSDWVAWQRNDTDRVELVTDKHSYAVGDVAKVLVKSPYPKAKAMVTVEREGVLSRRLVDLEGSVSTVDVPITEAAVPNVFVGVLIMRPRVAEGGVETGDDPGRPNARIGLVKLDVERGSRRLAVKVTTDKADYRPKETVQVSLEVKDAAGRPASGEATVFAVDEAVLRLTGYQTPDPIAAIFPERPLSVRLGEPLLHLVRKRSYGEKGEEQGGGGGASGEGAGFRSDFRTTALFAPAVEVKNGRASTSFQLPDNLTTFRVMAVIVTDVDRFGSGDTSLQVNKPLMALPALPRFARVGDAFEAGVVVHKKGAADGDVTVTAEVEGGAALAAAASRTVRVAEGAPREVRFAFKATAPGPTKFRFMVKGGGASDGVQETIPIELPVEMDAVATYGDTTGERVEGIKPPKDVYVDRGGLTVTLASTSLTGLDQGFQQLIEYPWGCAEQQASRLVPFMALREVAGQFKVPWPGPNAKTQAAEGELSALFGTLFGESVEASGERHPDKVIARTVKALLALQESDGSFRYWPSSICSSSWVSAYVTLTLSRARDIGFEVPADRLNRATDFLAGVVGGRCAPCERGCDDETRVFAAYALARARKPKASSYAELFGRRNQLSLFSRALLANAMFVGGGDRAQAKALLQEVLNYAKEDPSGVHLEEASSRTYATYFNSDTRTTGVVLEALTDISPDHPYVAKMARYLTGVRRGNGQWRSTQEAAFSLMALTEVLRTKEKDTPDFKATVALGTASLLEESFKGRSLQPRTKTLPMRELAAKAGGEERLTFKKQGPGVLYYSALLRYAPKELPMTPLDVGLFVQRWFEPWSGGGQTTRVYAGDLVRVRVRVASNQERHWAVFEVPLPAGLEPVDTSLATTARLPQAPDEASRDFDDDESENEEGADRSASVSRWAYAFWSPFTHTEMRDDRVAIFADHLPPGVHSTSFVARATTPGTFVLKPAQGTLMYQPEVWGRSAGGAFEVLLPDSVSQK